VTASALPSWAAVGKAVAAVGSVIGAPALVHTGGAIQAGSTGTLKQYGIETAKQYAQDFAVEKGLEFAISKYAQHAQRAPNASEVAAMQAELARLQSEYSSLNPVAARAGAGVAWPAWAVPVMLGAAVALLLKKAR
jgi:hypothetical protein